MRIDNAAAAWYCHSDMNENYFIFFDLLSRPLYDIFHILPTIKSSHF